MKKLLILTIAVILAAGCKKEPPVALFSVDKTEVFLTQEVKFTNSSTDADSYTWDFGDQTNSTEVNPTHSYSKFGTFIVTLTAHGSGQDNFQATVNVFEGKASYQLKNNSSYGMNFYSFCWNEATEELEDYTELGYIAPNGISGVFFTNRAELNLALRFETLSAIVTDPFFITNFENNIFTMTNQTHVYSGNATAKIKAEDIQVVGNAFRK